MKLLKMTVSNHRSFRDSLELDLMNQPLDTNLPREGREWSDYVGPVVAIFGANAAGKTSIVKAFHYVVNAISRSAGSWLDAEYMPRDPFKLDSNANEGPSSYQLDFVLNENWHDNPADNGEFRFIYDFSVGPEGIMRESLLKYRSRRATILFSRPGNTAGDVTFGPKVPKMEVSPRELILSRAMRIEHPVLAPIARAIVGSVQILRAGDNERDARLRRLTRDIVKEKFSLEEIQALARVADVGIEHVIIDEKEVPTALVNRLSKLSRNDSEETVQEDEDNDKSEPHPKITESVIDEIIINLRHSLAFKHRSSDTSLDVEFELSDESDGTLAWLSLAVAVVKTLRSGGILCVDELDTSLHPFLASQVVELFQNAETNPNQGQLIFTSHDVALLMPQSSVDLEKRQIWFVEKDNSGISELYSLDDFPEIGPKSNVAKKYLEGQLGAVPRLAPAVISQFVLRSGNVETQRG